MKDRLSDSTFNTLKKLSNEQRNSSQDFRRHLAGNLAEEYKLTFDQSQKEIVYGELIGLAQKYMTEARNQRRIKKFGRPDVNNIQIIDPIWVNFMKAGEWNPVHFHAGAISCVMYLSVPPQIAQENTQSDHASRSNQPSAGKIQWTYGESIQFTESFFIQTPEEKDIWFFPAELKHFVYPFKSQVERVSISCNFK
jgi:hypothetical protein